MRFSSSKWGWPSRIAYARSWPGPISKGAGIAWFESRKTKERKSHFKNLVMLALSDGNLDDKEHGVLCAVGQKWGLSEAQANDVLANPDRVKFILPNDPEERFHQLYELVVMMLADGEITADEMDLCVTLAAHMGFRPSTVKELVEKIVQGTKQQGAEKKVRSDVDEFLSEG